MIREAIKKMSDVKMDQALKGKKVLTFERNPEAEGEFGKTTTVYITQDQKYFHISDPSNDPVVMKWVNKIIKQYKLKKLK